MNNSILSEIEVQSKKIGAAYGKGHKQGLLDLLEEISEHDYTRPEHIITHIKNNIEILEKMESESE